VIKDSKIEIHFPVVHQYWMDSGLLGFYYLANKAQKNNPDISFRADDSGVYLSGTKNKLEIFLNEVYQKLLDQYYNTSTPKQISENAGFYYNSKEDTFVRFPKVKTMGISNIIFSKAPRPTESSISYKNKKTHQFPDDYAHLQKRFDDFLEENELKVDPNVATFLIDGRNAYQPKVNISLEKTNSKGQCYLCNSSSNKLSEVSGTAFPLITGSSGIKSFNSGCEKPFSICWMCDYIGKFVPVSGYYSMNEKNTYVFLVYSRSFQKLTEVMSLFEAAKKYDENKLQNFEEKLGGYFQKSYEKFFSFMYTVYLTMCRHVDGDKETELDYEKMLDINISKAPLTYYIVHFQKLGKDSYVGKMVWNFTEAIYLFRLLSVIFERGISLPEVMRILVDYDQKNDESKTIIRNRICGHILKKQHIVSITEPFLYHISRSKKQYVKPVFEFVEAYERILYEGNTMKQELIDVGVSLGKTIGLKVGEDKAKGRGELFRLRKARKPEDFLNEVNRIQMKYGVSVTSDLYNKGELFGENFAEFKQFCMIAALNSYNAKSAEKEKKKGD